jgi:predicted metal-binding protein
MRKDKLSAIGEISPAELQDHLERYRKEAIKLGATDAKIITSEMVVFDKRVPLKCYVPLCVEYGSCIHCPPYALEADKIREIVQEYSYAILIKIDIEPSFLTGIEIAESVSKEQVKQDQILNELLNRFEKLYEIVGKIESMAFHDGHHLAAGFAAGSCNAALCKFQECQALQKNKKCRYPFKARPSMEASGMDVFRISTKAGWDIYPIGGSCEASAVPQGSVIGLVFID